MPRRALRDPGTRGSSGRASAGQAGAAASGKLSDEAYRRIRDRILRGLYPLGAPLKRRDLAREFRISVVPVSEALQRLEFDGLVETEPRKGTRVRIPAPRDVKDHIAVRAALECESARLCSQFATPEDRRDILDRAAHLDHLRSTYPGIPAGGEILYAIHSYHMEFHLRIAEAGGCEGLRRLIEQNQVLVLNWIYDIASDNERQPADFHRQLAAAVVGEDAGAAAEAMRYHVWWGWEYLDQAFRDRYWGGSPGGTAAARRWRAAAPAADFGGSSSQPFS